MTPSEAKEALALIDRLWPKAELSNDVRAGLARRLVGIAIDLDQFRAVAEELRLTSRYRNPSTADLLSRCKAAAPKPRAEALAQARQWRETPEHAAEVDGHNARTLAWVRGLTDEQIAAAFAALDRATGGAWKPKAETRASLERSEFTRGMLYAACEAEARAGEGAWR